MSSLREYIKKILFFFDYFIWLILSPFKFKSLKIAGNKKILVINHGFIGDLLATTPLIKAISKLAKVDLLVRPEMVDLLKENPHINKIIPFTNYALLLSEIKNKYSCAIIIWPRSFKLVLTLLKAKIPIRIGYAQPELSISSLLLTKNIFTKLKSHKVQQNLSSGLIIGAKAEKSRMEISIQDRDTKKPDSFAKKIGKYVIIHPGKRTVAGKNYLWTPEGFSEIADFLIEKKKMSVLIGGSKEDTSLAKKIISLTKNKKDIFDVTGKFNLKEYARLISKSELLVSIDTSAIHFASCFNKKIVCLFCCYPEVWHPWEDKKNYSLIFNEDLKNVSPKKVKEEINKLL